MALWTNNDPCKCGKKTGRKLKCENCSTLGCSSCVGEAHATKSMCKTCKKNDEVGCHLGRFCILAHIIRTSAAISNSLFGVLRARMTMCGATDL